MESWAYDQLKADFDAKIRNKNDKSIKTNVEVQKIEQHLDIDEVDDNKKIYILSYEYEDLLKSMDK